MRQQIADGNKQRKQLLDAYEAGVIELHEFVSRRNACNKKIERAEMKLNDLYVVNGEELSGGNLKNNIKSVMNSFIFFEVVNECVHEVVKVVAI